MKVFCLKYTNAFTVIDQLYILNDKSTSATTNIIPMCDTAFTKSEMRIIQNIKSNTCKLHYSNINSRLFQRSTQFNKRSNSALSLFLLAPSVALYVREDIYRKINCAKGALPFHPLIVIYIIIIAKITITFIIIIIPIFIILTRSGLGFSSNT